jgi:hypothetical protein
MLTEGTDLTPPWGFPGGQPDSPIDQVLHSAKPSLLFLFFPCFSRVLTSSVSRSAPSVGHGCKQLLSDMQAFKAANPGCILEDFVRWYSPPDFIQGVTPTPPSKSRPHSRGRPETPQPEGGPRTEDSPATPSTSTGKRACAFYI